MKFADNLKTSEGLQRNHWRLQVINSYTKPFMPGLFKKEHLVPTPISSPLLQEKAKLFHHQLHAQTTAYTGGALDY